MSELFFQWFLLFLYIGTFPVGLVSMLYVLENDMRELESDTDRLEALNAILEEARK